MRPQWRAFLHALDRLGLGEVTRRWDEARQLIRENGVTYNVYGDPRGLGRPWPLDPIPLLISAAESADLETGLVQRARLLEAILADLYGPQQLLHEGLLPAGIDLRPSRLPAALSRRPAGRRPLSCTSTPPTSAARDGRPLLGPGRPHAGAVGSRLRPGKPHRPVAHAAGRVPRLPGAAAGPLLPHPPRDAARRSPRDHRDNPRIVLLTPGPYNETYFEHAYLARYLGYTLVEGGDLTVRDDRVYLKLLGGLQPVDVILRRLDDDYCDPLELRGDSFLGVPGLVQAVRAGNVAVANPLGSGLVETPALLAFLPALCRRLLGEELRMPSVPTWWCGDPTAPRPRAGQPAAAGHQADVSRAGPRADLRRTARRGNSCRTWPIAFGRGRAITSARSGWPCPPTPVLAGGRLAAAAVAFSAPSWRRRRTRSRRCPAA